MLALGYLGLLKVLLSKNYGLGGIQQQDIEVCLNSSLFLVDLEGVKQESFGWTGIFHFCFVVLA